MLIRYKKSYEKIAMGLLSFVPSEKELKVLTQTMKRYNEGDHCHLFLWKEEEDIIGLIGVERREETVVVQHLSVSPSHRHQGIGKQLVVALKQFFPGERIDANEVTATFVAQCNVNQS